MEEQKKTLKRGFGRSFEDAYLNIADRMLLDELAQGDILRSSGKHKSLFAAQMDMAERKKFEERMVQSEKLAEIGTLASGIAHGINNPLAGIMGYAEIMRDEQNLDSVKTYADKILNEAEKAADIVHWLSRYSRQAKDSNIKDVDLNEVIDESLEVIKHNQRSSNIEIERNYQRIPNIKGNPIELQQIFVSLIDNAIEAMPNGGKLCFSAQMSHDNIEVKISDIGVGIPKENLGKIFDPFFTTKKMEKSTGLGLYVTSMIVNKHHGEIHVASQVGKGTTITLKFPISKV